MTDDELRAAVDASRSWRGVLRVAGRTSPRYARELRARCDALGIDYAHFRAGPGDDVVRAAVAEASTWREAVAAAGYAEDSGSARAQLRKRCLLLGVSTEHLDRRARGSSGASWGLPHQVHLRDAGPMLVAAHLTLSGHRVSWPLEPAPYDLLVDHPSGMRRIQVKTGTIRAGEGWQCSLTRSVYDAASGYCVRGYYGQSDIDDFAIVDGDLAIYVVPLDVVRGRSSITLNGYGAYRLAGSGEPAALIG
jgi:hypothetical protein